MSRRSTHVTFAVALLLHFVHSSTCTGGDDVYLLQSESLPNDLNFMPTMGNGHLGYTVFGDAIYVNGIYNGHGGDSKRARIPNWLNISLSAASAGALELLAPKYEMNLAAGCFRWTQTSASGHVLLEQRVYAHRHYTRALVYDFRLLRMNNTNVPLNLTLVQRPGNESDAFDFLTNVDGDSDNGNGNGSLPPAGSSNYKTMMGATRLVEHEHFQTAKKRIFILFSDYWQNEKLLFLPAGKKYLTYRYVLTIDEQRQIAKREMDQVLAHTPRELLARHKLEWELFWDRFNVAIGHNIALSRIINAGIFYMASSLPSANSYQPSAIFYGLSPTGLGRGRLAADYEGHTFWDTEIWMLPIVTQLSPHWARQLFDYRIDHVDGARFNALLTGYQGARYPWESAFTGTEVTQPCCPEVAAQEVHISADIVVALKAHYATTADDVWLCEKAWPLSTAIATFLSSRVAYNNKTAKYHINLVMGPDEDHWNVNDSVYTNVAFRMALEFASYAMLQCSDSNATSNSIPEQWLNIANNLHICYDDQFDYHPEYANYERGVVVKQADVVLLGYPLQYQMNSSTRRNDLEYYEQVTRPSGPAMTWSMFAINYLDIGEWTKADMFYQRGYKDYVRQPYNVWSETTIGYEGSANFLTGIGGFLQALLNGYAGIRFYRVQHSKMMELKPARLPPETESITINGIKFANATFTMHIRYTNFSTIKCTQLGSIALSFSKDNQSEPLHEGVTYYVTNTTAYFATSIE